jgi:hypothetical protein
MTGKESFNTGDCLIEVTSWAGLTVFMPVTFHIKADFFYWFFFQKYFQSGPFKTLNNNAGKSYLEMEWTNQHGCGGNEDTNPQKQNCQMILQYMCQDDVDSPTGILSLLYSYRILLTNIKGEC